MANGPRFATLLSPAIGESQESHALSGVYQI